MGPNLTAQQLEALIKSGDLTLDNGTFKALTKEEKDLAMPFLIKQMQDTKQIGQPGVDMSAVLPAAGLLAPSVLPKVAGLGDGMGPVVKGAAGMYGIEKLKDMGVPAPIANALEAMLGFKLMMGGGGKSGKAEPVREAPLGERRMPMSDADFKSYTGGRERGQFTSMLSGPPKNVTKTSPANAIAAEGDMTPVTGGADKFLFGRPQGAYSGNVNTQPSFDDLLEMITRSSSEGAPSPLKYHESAPKDMRKSVDALKRTVRRQPK